jgi:hypothetical protein
LNFGLFFVFHYMNSLTNPAERILSKKGLINRSSSLSIV